MSNETMLDTVRGALEEITRAGSLQRMLDSLTEDAVIRVTAPPGTPLSREFHGKEGMKEYFAALGEVFEVLELNITGYLAGDNKVVVLPVERLKVRRTQREITVELALVFSFRDDKIARFLAIGDLSAAFAEPG